MSETNATRERRRFFRIDETVYLSYRLLDKAGLEQRLKELGENGFAGDSLQEQLFAMQRQGRALLATIAKSQPEIAQYLSLLDKRISLLSQQQTGRVEEASKPNMRIDVRDCGASFVVDEYAEPGHALEVKLVFFPDRLTIHALARVAHCREVAAVEAGRTAYRIGIEFTHIDAEAQESLSRHVLSIQAQRLREEREAKGRPG
jgi:c-di-GMP-binding flagellar brake protein YcgR